MSVDIERGDFHHKNDSPELVQCQKIKHLFKLFLKSIKCP